MIHLLDGLKNGACMCQVRTVDNDVVVILVGKLFYLLEKYPSAGIWVAFETGKDYKCININEIYKRLET